MKELHGITWGHVRGHGPLETTTIEFQRKNTDVSIIWDIRSLKDFGDYPIELLAEKYDLILMDHPFIGTGVQKQLLIPLDEYIPANYLEDQKKNSVGNSYSSYTSEGHQWALAVDAAAQVSAYRADFFQRLHFNVPRTWKEVFDLIAGLPKEFKVGLPLCPTDAICSFISLCANIGGNEFWEDSIGINPNVGEEAFKLLLEIAEKVHPNSFNLNPIEMLDEMANGNEVVYVPLIFGYSNYSRTGFKPNLIHFTNIPTTHDQPSGGLLGGVGLGISSLSNNKREAIDYAVYIASGECQSGLYFDGGGQPGHRSAWEDNRVNELSHDFFRSTLQTLDLSYLRPRYPGYNAFQEKAGDIVRENLLNKTSASAVIKELNTLYSSLT